MKTNQLMKRPMGQFEVLQRTSDSYFDANALVSQWNNIKGNPRRKISEYLKSSKTIEFINAIENNNADFQAVKEIKGRNTRHGRTANKVWMHPYLFIKFVQWIDEKLYCDIKNSLIESGDLKKEVEVEFIRDEVSTLNVLCKALDAVDSPYKYTKQYPCLDGKYRIDLLLYNESTTVFDDGSKRTDKSFVIIEYDEEQHNNLKNSIADSLREKEICQYLKEKSRRGVKNIEDVLVRIDILRIKRGEEGLFYAYAIPIFTYIDTSYCEDKLTELMDYRRLYDEEFGEDYFNIGLPWKYV